jgi:hypothetical protein
VASKSGLNPTVISAVTNEALPYLGEIRGRDARRAQLAGHPVMPWLGIKKREQG